MVQSETLDTVYMNMAFALAELSNAERAQVGCLIVKDTHILSEGVNGTPSGFSNICEDEFGITKPEVLHAESNAIAKLAKSTESSDGATAYTTHSPCYSCAKLLIQAGIKRVVYKYHYGDYCGRTLLAKAGVPSEGL